MSERDELAKMLFIADNHESTDPEHEWEMSIRHNAPYTEYTYLFADVILAAGYRKPRTITTADELDVLLRGDANIVLLDEDGISLQNLVGGWQAATGSRRLMTSDLAFHCFGPTFTVLHEGEVK